MALTFTLMPGAPKTTTFFLLGPKFLEDPGIPVYLSYSDHVDPLLLPVTVMGHQKHLIKHPAALGGIFRVRRST